MANFTGSCFNYADAPGYLFVFGEAPSTPCSTAFARKIVGEECRCLHSCQHPVTVTPGFKSEKCGRFSETVTNGSMRLYPEVADDVTDNASGCHLAEDESPVIVPQLCRLSAVPEEFRLELVAQVEVCFILASEYLRPTRRELNPHPWVVVAGARKDKTDFCVLPHGCRSKEEAVTQVRLYAGNVPFSGKGRFALFYKIVQFSRIPGNNTYG
jgi:hypothetical protein